MLVIGDYDLRSSARKRTNNKRKPRWPCVCNLINSVSFLQRLVYETKVYYIYISLQIVRYTICFILYFSCTHHTHHKCSHLYCLSLHLPCLCIWHGTIDCMSYILPILHFPQFHFPKHCHICHTHATHIQIVTLFPSLWSRTCTLFLLLSLSSFSFFFNLSNLRFSFSNSLFCFSRAVRLSPSEATRLPLLLVAPLDCCDCCKNFRKKSFNSNPDEILLADDD